MTQYQRGLSTKYRQEQASLNNETTEKQHAMRFCHLAGVQPTWQLYQPLLMREKHPLATWIDKQYLWEK